MVMSWPLRIATLSKGVGAFTLTLNRAPILLNGRSITLRLVS